MISLEPVGTIRSPRAEAIDDDWGNVVSTIELNETFDPSALQGLEEFSHAEILFHLHQVPPESIQRGTRYPRGNPSFPAVGIFAQRGRARPNRLADPRSPPADPAHPHADGIRSSGRDTRSRRRLR